MGIEDVENLKEGDDQIPADDANPNADSPAPSGQEMHADVADQNLGSIADGDQIPPSEEEITQDEAPINPEEADE